MTEKHTPGPWRISGCRIVDQLLILGGDEKAFSPIVGSVYTDEGRLPQAANARLIAAAPTMADAIRAAAHEAAVGADADGAFARIPRALFDALENALDAATGEYSKETS